MKTLAFAALLLLAGCGGKYEVGGNAASGS